jgi:hypothetical protein
MIHELAMSELEELDLLDELIPPLLINETEDIDLFKVLQDTGEEQTQLFFNMPDDDLDDFYLGFLEGKSPTQKPPMIHELAMSKLEELDLLDELSPPLLINETEDIDLFKVLQDTVKEQTQLFFDMPDGDLDDFYLGFLEGKSPTQTIGASLSGGKCLH